MARPERMQGGSAIQSALPRKKGFLYELKRNKILFVMLIPTFVYFLLNSYMPMVGVYFAFTRYNFRDGLFGSPFVGLENFKFLYKSGKLFSLTANTIGYNVAFILIANVLQVALAIILSRLSSKLFKRITQSVIFLPFFVSYVILSGTLRFEYQKKGHRHEVWYADGTTLQKWAAAARGEGVNRFYLWLLGGNKPASLQMLMPAREGEAPGG